MYNTIPIWSHIKLLLKTIYIYFPEQIYSSTKTQLKSFIGKQNGLSFFGFLFLSGIFCKGKFFLFIFSLAGFQFRPKLMAFLFNTFL